MMDYIEEYSDHDPNTSNRKDNDGFEETFDSVELSQIKNSSDNQDPLIKAFNSFHNLQEVLNQELQKFQELGKESKSLLHDEAESRSCIHTRHELANGSSSSHRFRSENMGEFRLTSLDSEILNLVNNVNHLETKLDETKSIIDAKNSQIHELESNNRGGEIGNEDIFCQKMEAEIEYLILSTSKENLKKRIKLIKEEKILAEEQAHRMLSKLGEVETKAEKLKTKAEDLQNCCVEIGEIQEVKSFKKRVSKTTSCLLIQLGLLFIVFSFRFRPELETVVPT